MDVVINGVRYIPHPENKLKWSSIGEALKHLRGVNRLSLDEAAKQVGVSKRYLWEIETGKANNPSFQAMAALADLYGVSLDAFPRLAKPTT